MKGLRLWAAWIAAVMAFGPLPALAAPQDAVFNKEHVWAIDVDRGACAASRTLPDGSTFLFRAQKGKLSFGYFSKTALREGHAGRLETEAYSFDFAPSYVGHDETLYFNGNLSARVVAALRLAREVRILTDGRLVVAMTFEGTGFESALDGVIACSNGESGWWGKGLAVEAADAAKAAPPRAAALRRDFVMNKENTWGILVGDDPAGCVGQAAVDDHLNVQILGAGGRLALGVGSDGDLPQGRRGRVETDSYAFDFTPRYSGKGYMSSDELFDSAAVFALHRAKWLRASVDGRKLVDVDLTDTGFAELLDSVAACSRGERGWWGEGAKRGK